MFSLRVYLFSLLLILPFYTYSLNAPVEEAEKRDDLEDFRQELDRRQDLVTDTAILASASAAVESLNSIVSSITANSDNAIDYSSIYASLSSALGSVSSEIYSSDTNDDSSSASPASTSPTSASASATSTSKSASQTSGSSQSSVTSAATLSVGATTIFDGKTGTVGEDGSLRYCSASSTLCPASVSYGCCYSGLVCGLTICSNPSNTATVAASCATGMYQCPSSLGSGCCSTGYACVSNYCQASATSDGQVVTATRSTTDFFFETQTQVKGSATASMVVTASPVSSSSKGLSGGAIGGIVGGVVGGIALIAAGLLFFCCKKKRSRNTPMPAGGTHGNTHPSEQYTGGPLPPQPQMAQYGSPQSPPPHEQGGYYQPGSNQQQYSGQPGHGGYPNHGHNVAEIGGTALPYGQKAAESQQPIYEAPANPAQHQPLTGAGKTTGPVYELS